MSIGRCAAMLQQRSARTAVLAPWLLVLIAAIGLDAFAATAAPPKVERWLAVADAGAAARGRFFSLLQRAAPLCQTESIWTLGDPPFFVQPEPPRYDRAREIREIVQAEFGARPGEYVFTWAPTGTPFGKAGARRGDRLVAADSRRWNVLEELRNDAPTGTRPGGGETAQGAPAKADLGAAKTYRQVVAELSAELAVDRERRFILQRGEERIPVLVVASRVCPVGFNVVDSEYRYADASGNDVFVTLPLITSLDDDELTMVLAHELSHILLKHQRNDISFPWGGKLGTPIGALAQMAQNRELESYPLADNELIDSDRLTLWLLKGEQISPHAYLQFLDRMKGEDSIVPKATYARTRPLTPQRAAALREEAVLYDANRSFRLPRGVAQARLQEVVAVGRPTANAGGDAQADGASPAAGERAVSAPDFDRRPLRALGLERFQHYLTLKSPKAFFVFENSAWRFWSDTADPVGKGFAYCRREQKKCFLYAVDQSIVWQTDASRRIVTAEQWEGLSRASAGEAQTGSKEGAPAQPR